MTSQLIPTVRLAADIADFNAPRDLHTGRMPTIWRGNDFQIQLGVFWHGKLQSTADIASVVVALKPCDDSNGAPSMQQEPYLQKEILAADFDCDVSEEGWKNGSQQQVLIPFSAVETCIPPGECWLVIWAKMRGDPAAIVTLCAGHMAILESSGGIFSPPAIPPDPAAQYYDKSEADGRFLRQEANLADLRDMAQTYANLDLRSAASAELLDESDFISNSPSAVASQRSTRAYVDGAMGVLQQNLNALEQLVQGGAGNPITGTEFAMNYWPSNARLNCWSNGTKVNLAADTATAGPDGWMGFRETANSRLCSMQLQPISGDDENKILRVIRQNMDNQLSEIVLYRPFLPCESCPLRGKTLTLSFDIACGASFPWDDANAPLKLCIFGHNDTAVSLQKLGKTGQFPSGHIELKSLELRELTTQTQRRSLTFTVPKNLQQLGIKFAHLPVKINAAVGTNYYFELSKFSLVDGETAGDYRPFPLEVDWNHNKLCYQKIVAHYEGPTITGLPVALSFNFPLPFVAIPDCKYVMDSGDPVGFSAATADDVQQISTEHCVISRIAQSDTGHGSFDSTYWLAYYLW